jgi:ketosteroid isomerase-like protein
MFKSAVVALLFVVTFVAVSARADETGAAAEVAKSVEALRAAMVAGNEAQLNALTNDHLTYGHSHGMLQDKTAFVKYLVGPKAPGKFNWIKLSNQTVNLVNSHTAWVRHTFDAENEAPDGKISKAHILVLQVWTKEKGGWKLLARQACVPD